MFTNFEKKWSISKNSIQNKESETKKSSSQWKFTACDFV